MQTDSSDWEAVDAYIVDKLVGADPALASALEANAAAGLPAIDVSPAQGKLLNLLIRLGAARRVLEIGTLGGYSTIWMARGLPEGGKVVTLEIDTRHARVAEENVARAGLSDKVEIRVGAALDLLAEMDGAELFDFVFVDADKENNANYLREAVRLSRLGAAILIDNVVRDGRVIRVESGDPAIAGTRRLFDALAASGEIDATAIQTVGIKGWDGFALAIVGGREVSGTE